jgi:hypothetical protein
VQGLQKIINTTNTVAEDASPVEILVEMSSYHSTAVKASVIGLTASATIHTARLTNQEANEGVALITLCSVTPNRRFDDTGQSFLAQLPWDEGQKMPLFACD